MATADKLSITTLVHATSTPIDSRRESHGSPDGRERASDEAMATGEDLASLMFDDDPGKPESNRRRHTDNPTRPKPRTALAAVATVDDSVIDDRDADGAFCFSMSSSHFGLMPRAPTGSEWSGARSKSGAADSNVVGLHDMLKDLDEHARRKPKTASLTRDDSKVVLAQPISWKQEDTGIHHHIWHEVDSREACHLYETHFCQEVKMFRSRRSKVRCSACKVLVHTSCVDQLYFVGVCCKPTFREIKRKVENTNVMHHFLPRRRLGGKCKKCERGFGNWMKFSGREIVGTSCSWCGDSYHQSCFSVKLKEEVCHLGPLRDLIVPPSWVIKIPAMEQNASKGGDDTGKGSGHSKKRSRRSRKKKTDEKQAKHFTVKALSQRQHKPLLVFINPKSGGNQGAKLMQVFQWLLNPRQVFDLTNGGPILGLKMFRNVSNLRILACGGDGTVGWVLSVLDELEMKPPPPIAVLPLGTGNDCARVLGWGGGYSDEPLDKILMHVSDGPVVEMDRWHLSVWPNPNAQEHDGIADVPLHVINNYFSIGADAQIALEFHLGREANPEKFNNRIKNKMFYGKVGGKDILQRKFSNLTDHLQLFGDAEDLTPRIRQLRLEAICFLNIPSYGAGTHPWGNPSSRDPRIGSQHMDDGKIEVLGFWASSFPKLQVGIAHGERIAQCEHIKLITERSFPVQIDGEACKLHPSVMEVGLKNRALMIRKVARKSSLAPFVGVQPSDRIKLSVSKVTSEQYERLYYDIPEIRTIAIPLGLVMATTQSSLRDMREQVERFCIRKDDGECALSAEWRFLDVATFGRDNRMFQVLLDQEDGIRIADILSDGIIVVELELSPAGSPKAMGKFTRNKSYDVAIEDLRIPMRHDSLPEGELCGTWLSPTRKTHPLPVLDEDGYEADIEIVLPQIADTGSDSTGGEADSSSESNQKAFTDAIKRGNIAKVKEYHEKGAILTVCDGHGWTPLHHAARLGKVEVVQYLADHLPKEALDLVEEEKLQTALHKAAWYGYQSICEILVNKGASLTRKDYQGNTPFQKSIQSEDYELMHYLEDNERRETVAVEDAEMAV